LKWIVFLFSVGIMLSVKAEQRVNVKFCVKLGKSATEMYDLLRKTTCSIASNSGRFALSGVGIGEGSTLRVTTFLLCNFFQ
jgi:hypothetical protein